MAEKTLEYYMSLDYTVEIQELPAQYGGGYVALIPLLGASNVTGWGDTPGNALSSLEKKKAETFEEWLEKGVEIPEPADGEHGGEITITLPKSLHRKISEIAQREETDLDTCIVRLLTNAVLLPH